MFELIVCELNKVVRIREVLSVLSVEVGYVHVWIGSSLGIEYDEHHLIVFHDPARVWYDLPEVGVKSERANLHIFR